MACGGSGSGTGTGDDNIDRPDAGPAGSDAPAGGSDAPTPTSGALVFITKRQQLFEIARPT